MAQKSKKWPKTQDFNLIFKKMAKKWPKNSRFQPDFQKNGQKITKNHKILKKITKIQKNCKK